MIDAPSQLEGARPGGHRHDLHPGRRRLAGHVEQADAAAAPVVLVLAGAPSGVDGQEPLHHVGGRRRVLLEDEGRRPRGHGRSLGRPAAPEVPIAEASLRVGGVHEGAGHPQTLQAAADGDHVRPAVGAVGGTGRVDAGAVVALERRALGVEAAHPEDERVPGRVGEPGLGDEPAVAGRRHHEDPVLPGLLDGVGERVDRAVLGRVGAVGEVEHPDVHPVVVLVLHDPVDGRDHLGHIDAAVGVGNLEGDDAGIGGHPPVGRRRGGGVRRRDGAVLAGDEPGHERAVTVRVELGQVRRLRLHREVGAVDHLAGRVEARNRRDARVDDGDVDTGTGPAGVPPVLGAGDGGGGVHRVRIGGRVIGDDRRNPGVGDDRLGDHVELADRGEVRWSRGGRDHVLRAGDRRSGQGAAEGGRHRHEQAHGLRASAAPRRTSLSCGGLSPTPGCTSSLSAH